jgi:magnesium transporter
MTVAHQPVATTLNRRYFLDHSQDAAKLIESLPVHAVVPALSEQPPDVVAVMWARLAPPIAATLFTALPEDDANALLEALDPNHVLVLLGQFEPSEREAILERAAPPLARELRRLMTYPENSAGRLMDTHITVLRHSLSVDEAIEVLRTYSTRTWRSVFLIDDDNRLTARVTFQRLATSAGGMLLSELSEPIIAAVKPVEPREEVAELFDRYRLSDLPVVDMDGALIGIIYNTSLVDVLQEEVSVDMQTMVGASKDEHALSKVSFAVLKRQPWLQVNLLTAFAAASVVGLFESTIAQFTALAVLLPVVAGQSGNAGAQALAVTMRGLALREITLRHWLRVLRKEVGVGFINGVGIAITCGLGVLVWSGSIGLVLVIASSMVLAMVAAGFAGALVPIVLTRLGQDPAQASSIVLTTVTDIAGFFSFLGIATLLSGML